MPLLTVEIVTRPNEQLPPSLAKQLADSLGELFGSEPAGTWVRLRSLASERYAEGPGEVDDVFPVFVTILKARLPSEDAMQGEVDRVTQVVSRLCDRPTHNVQLQYLPPGAGHVAFGGRIVTS